MGTKKQQIIDSSVELFAKFGYGQIGMDFIAVKANVSKMTIYKHFSTKEKLFEEVLIEREKRFHEALLSGINKTSNPIDKIKSIFIFYHHWFNQEGFNGCLFINSTYLFANKHHKFKQLIKNKKTMTQKLIEEILCPITNPTVSAKLAADIVRLLDGAIVGAQVKEENETPAIDAWETVLSLFKANDIAIKSTLSF